MPGTPGRRAVFSCAMANRATTTPAPFGISGLHCGVERYARLRTPLATLIFLGMLVAASLGLLGGTGTKVRSFAAPDAAMMVEYQPILRSGNWFETIITVTPRRDVKDLVVAIDYPLWRGMSIDTISPDAESAEGLDGRYSFHFAEVKRGQTFRLKLDGQIQPRSLRTLRGNVSLLDDTRPLLSAPLSITVLP